LRVKAKRRSVFPASMRGSLEASKFWTLQLEELENMTPQNLCVKTGRLYIAPARTGLVLTQANLREKQSTLLQAMQTA
jgi:hypothetical protein